MLPGVPCPECGYDLRASREGRCPECGFAYDHEAITSLYREAIELRLLNDSEMIDFAVLIAALLLPGDLSTALWGHGTVLSLLVVGHGLHLQYALSRFGIMDPDDPRRSWLLMFRPVFLLLCIAGSGTMLAFPGLTRFLAALAVARMWQRYVENIRWGFERGPHEPQPERPLTLRTPLSQALLYGTTGWFVLSLWAWLGS